MRDCLLHNTTNITSLTETLDAMRETYGNINNLLEFYNTEKGCYIRTCQ